MSAVTYYVVVPFSRDEDGMVMAREAKEAPNADAARRRAQAVSAASGYVGAIAFSRTGDPERGDFADAVVIATYGEFDMKAMGE